MTTQYIKVTGASEHNLKGLDIDIERGKLTVITGVSGSGKSSLAFDTVLAEAQRRFFYTLSHYSRQFLDLGSRPAVKQISGLSPAIALAQNETMPSRRSTVGTLSDVSELLGVCFARFSDKHCPKHGEPTSNQTPEQVADRILADHANKTVVVCIPLATQKKGNFATKMRRFAVKGFSRAYVDGEVLDLNPVPELVKEEKHTIKVFIDAVKVADRNRNRLIRSIATSIEEGDGFGEYYVAKSSRELDLKSGGAFSERGGCSVCGYSWPDLDSRYFSANSLGRCEACDGYGTVDYYEDGDYAYEFDYEDADQLSDLDQEDLRCPDCEGTGLDAKVKAITIKGLSAIDCQKGSVAKLVAQIDEWLATELGQNPAVRRVIEQIKANLTRIVEVGLGYLQLSRRIRSLSGGELQRLKLAGILGESLKGVLYVLDEPSQGLHPAEIDKLCETLDRLKQKGNTLLVVDHDETLMRHADWIIDLGPGGGARGGQLMAKFAPSQAKDFTKQSLTAKHLTHRESITVEESEPGNGTDIIVKQPALHNLKIDEVRFKQGRMNVVTGVSGAGKSSLVLSVLSENVRDHLTARKAGKKHRFRFCKGITGLDDVQSIHIIDRKPVAKSSVSLPATYLDVFTDLRNMYGKLPNAQVAGLTAASFSLAREGGRCESCKGRGEIALQMRFLADAKVRCHVCGGKRYRPHVLEIRYNGLNLAEVLELTIDEAVGHFKTFSKVQKRLAPAIDLGLGYLKLGQPSSSLSGGEAQRLKLVPFLAKRHGKGDFLILDEPTTGLHFEDVHKLLYSMRKLVAQEATVVLIEHNIDVAMSADWLIDLGPGSASEGGRLLYEGLPNGLRKMDTPTARFLDF